jgi:hypothetical protein
MRTTSSTSKERIGRAKKATQCMRLRISGLTLDQVGEKMGFSGSRAGAIIKQELARLNKTRTETAAQLARLELERLDYLFQAVWDKAQRGDIAAQKQCLAVMERRAKLLGLDAGDKPTAEPANVILSVNEVLIQSREEIANGGTITEAIQAPQVAIAIPAQ